MGDEPATRHTSPMPTAVLAAERLASLAKPPGSLGTLEEWAATLCTMQATLTPAAAPQTVVVFCADSMWDTRPRCGRPARPQPADWPRLDEAWGSLRHALALSEASGAPAGRRLSNHLVFCAGADHGVKKADEALSPFPASVSVAVFRSLCAGISGTAVLARAAGAHHTRSKSWLRPRPAGAPEASLSARACLRLLPHASPSLGAGRPYRPCVVGIGT